MNFLETLINIYKTVLHGDSVVVHSVRAKGELCNASNCRGVEHHFMCTWESCHKLLRAGKKRVSMMPTPRKQRKIITFEIKMEKQ